MKYDIKTWEWTERGKRIITFGERFLDSNWKSMTREKYV
jgi:hypothetical protein